MTRDDDTVSTPYDEMLVARLRNLDVGVPPALLTSGVFVKHKTGRRYVGRRRALAGLAAVAVVIAVLSATPVGAVLARAVLPSWLQQRFGLVVGAPAVVTPPCRPNSSGIPSANRGVIVTPNLSLSEAQRLVGFPIPTPGWLPPLVTFQGALAGEPQGSDRSQVYLYYASQKGDGGVGFSVKMGTPTGGSAVPAASAVRVHVNGQPGYFVHGSYVDSGPCTPARWNPSADDEELTWGANGYTYDLTVGKLNLSTSAVIRIADSVP